MSPLLRGGLFVVAFAGAFGLGHILTRSPAPAIPNVTVVAAAPVADSTIQTPMVEPPIVMPPVGPPSAPQEIPVDKRDLGFQVIEKQLGIQTTVVDKTDPPPDVLVQASKGPPVPVDVPPIGTKAGPDLPDLPAPVKDDIPFIVGPSPMDSSPMPRFDVPPPLPEIPVLANAVPFLNSRAVAFEFEVTKEGRSKVKAVELWASRDNGPWHRLDRMDGCKSPFRARLGEDGRYSFRLVLESESGLRSPAKGADLTLELDTTPPTVKLLPLSGVAGKVQIRWLMSDRHPDRSARLECSTDGRTWRRIEHTPVAPPAVQAGGSDGAIQHFACDWTPPEGVGHQVRIRVTVRDKAGNEAQAELPERVSIDLVAPEGKITGVRPEVTADISPMPRVIDGDEPPGAKVSVEDLLKSLIPVVLNSPVPVVLVGGESWDLDANSTPAPAASDLPPAWTTPRQLLADLTRTDVGFAFPDTAPPPPASVTEELLTGVVSLHRPMGFLADLLPPGMLSTRHPTPALGLTHYFREWRDLGRKSSEAVSSNRSVTKVLTETDWKPSTAAPESYEMAPWPRFGLPFNGIYDGPYWGSFPGGSIVLDF